MHRKILHLAVPNIISNLTVPLLTMVDLHLMGYLDSARFIGAVALGGVIFNLVYWLFAFLRMGVSGMTAQFFGAKDDKNIAQVLYRGLFIALLGGAFLILFQVPIEQLGFTILQGSPEVKELARNYFYIRIWAAPAAIAMMVFNGWFLGMQNAYFPMLTSILINIVNVFASFFFVKVLHLNEVGVAAGSVLAQYVGLLISLLLFHSKYKFVYPHFNFAQLFHTEEIRHFLSVNSDIFIRTFCVITVFTFFTSKSAAYGDVTLAANTALLQFLFLISYFLDGFAYAAEALVGRYVGEQNKALFKEAVRKLLLWGGIFGGIFSMLYFFFGDSFLLIFTNQSAVLTMAKPYLHWVVFIPLVGFASYIWDGIYIGAVASRLMRNTMLFSAIFMFFLPYFFLETSWGNHALWFSMVIFMFGRSLLQTIFSGRVFRKIKANVPHKL